MLEFFVSSSVLILTVIVLRLVCRDRISQKLQYAVWLLVALRLLIPVQLGSASFSISTMVPEQASSQVGQLVSRPVAPAAQPAEVPPARH